MVIPILFLCVGLAGLLLRLWFLPELLAFAESWSPDQSLTERTRRLIEFSSTLTAVWSLGCAGFLTWRETLRDEVVSPPLTRALWPPSHRLALGVMFSAAVLWLPSALTSEGTVEDLTLYYLCLSTWVVVVWDRSFRESLRAEMYRIGSGGRVTRSSRQLMLFAGVIFVLTLLAFGSLVGVVLGLTIAIVAAYVCDDLVCVRRSDDATDLFLAESSFLPPRLQAHPKRILVSSLLLGVSLIMLDEEWAWESAFLHSEDGLLEWLTVLIDLLAAALIGAAVCRYWLARRVVDQAFDRRVVAAWLTMVGGLCFVAMEEISWGQRIFDWQTPAVIESLNYQRETNLHNMFNPWLGPIYDITVFVVLMATFNSLRLRYQRRIGLLGDLVSPHPSLAGLSILILVACALNASGELLEELLAVFALSYGIRVFYVTRECESIRL